MVRLDRFHRTFTAIQRRNDNGWALRVRNINYMSRLVKERKSFAIAQPPNPQHFLPSKRMAAASRPFQLQQPLATAATKRIGAQVQALASIPEDDVPEDMAVDHPSGDAHAGKATYVPLALLGKGTSISFTITQPTRTTFHKRVFLGFSGQLALTSKTTFKGVKKELKQVVTANTVDADMMITDMAAGLKMVSPSGGSTTIKEKNWEALRTKLATEEGARLRCEMGTLKWKRAPVSEQQKKEGGETPKRCLKKYTRSKVQERVQRIQAKVTADEERISPMIERLANLKRRRLMPKAVRATVLEQERRKLHLVLEAAHEALKK